jgi:outer membrane protein assembly factor BamB
MHRFGIALIWVALLKGQSGIKGESWLTWGGPRADFTVRSSSLIGGPDGKWISAPPARLWERPLGEGYSPIAEENGVLYTAYRIGSQDVVIALDAATGKTRWEHAYEAPFRSAYSEEVGPGPYAMPQVVGDRVISASGAGQIHSLDKKTGKPVWSHDLYREFGGNRLEFGYSSHARPYKDSLLVLAGGNGSAILRLRQTDGSVIWKRHSLSNAYSSPLLIEVEGQPQAVALLAQEIVGFDPESGDLLWRHKHPTQYGIAISTPLWAPGNLLFLSSAYEGGSRVLQVSRNSVRELWHNPRVQLHFGSAIRDGDTIYVSSGHRGPAFLTAMELKTGRVLWQARDFAKAQLLAADGKLIILDQDGNLGIGLASPQGFQALAKWPLLTSFAWTPPTLVGTVLYARDRRTIMALNLTGKPAARARGGAKTSELRQ